MQLSFLEDINNPQSFTKPLSGQLLKWIGNKQRFAKEIISYFPKKYNTYFEPFLGSGAILATLNPQNAIASDSFLELIKIFQTLQVDPELLIKWYSDRWIRLNQNDKKK